MLFAYRQQPRFRVYIQTIPLNRSFQLPCDSVAELIKLQRKSQVAYFAQSKEVLKHLLLYRVRAEKRRYNDDE
ncbi:hypothetical protein L6164_008822 [Bauhinia variegata]|uniref:Uncharacterized protein n=1 Tax=Bauhinia variegata TaxID=167791 RepID=A0ACB9PKR1_BAUVA|nr:hypothetical protein L6164_008822 [Bauhinia variegata]